MTQCVSLPHDTAAELALDRVLHAFAILFAVGGVAWLFTATLRAGGLRQLIGLVLYAIGLIGMFVVSAAYNSCYTSPAKELLRRADHAMIFVMIAGTCTPFALSASPANVGLLLCTLVWVAASIGVVMKLAFPRRFERLLLATYLVMGWMMLGMAHAFADNLGKISSLLLFGGGIAYTCGVLVHARGRLPFHNVAWHGLVLLGASLHWAAVANQIAYLPGL